MGTTRRRRPWHGEAVSVPDPEPKPEGFPQWEHSSFTFEGEIERLGTISRNMGTAPRWARVVAKVVAAAILLPIALYLVAYLVHLINL